MATTPFLTQFREGENGWVVEWSGGDSPFQQGPYPGFEPFEVARIVVRLSEDLEPGEEVLVEPARVHLDHYGFPENLESGGVGDFFDRAHPFSPATEVRPGRILVNGGARFVRGDANADGRIDLSDAVHTLSYLFAGSSSPACLRAADADDDDLVVITDAIFLLGTLFLGEGRIPLPHPFCGTDTTEKELSCDAFPPCR